MDERKFHIDPMERFVENIDVLPNGCWQWNKSLVTFGYGNFSVRGTLFLAHRFAYMIFRGEIPIDKQLDHLCRNRGCVNPEHLEPVTSKENVLRGVGLTARHAKKVLCLKGHPLSGKNLYTRIDRTGRECRACRAKASMRYYFAGRRLNA